MRAMVTPRQAKVKLGPALASGGVTRLVTCRSGATDIVRFRDEREASMPIDPKAVGATTEPQLFEWTDRDTLLYALGVGAGLDDLSFTTENSHDIDQQVLPTYAVICCPAFGAAGKVGSFNWAMLLHGSQGIRLHAPLPAAGKLSVVTEVTDIQDKGEGKNAVVML